MREILEPIAHQLQHPQDLDRLLAAVGQRVVESLAAVCARLWLIRRGDLCQTCRWAADCPDKRRCLHLKANFGAPVDAAYRRAPLTVLSGEQLARGGIVTWAPPPSTAAMLLDPHAANAQGVVSFIAHPLRVENRVLGLLAVFGARMFTPADFELCAVYAAAASAAIRVAELANRVQRTDAAVRDKSRELDQRARLLTAVLTHSTDRAIVIEDLDGNILAFNEGARRAYGYAPEEVVGRATADKLHPLEDWQSGQTAKIYQQALEQGAYTGELRRRHQDGHIFVERATLTALRDEDGDPAGFITVAPVASEAASEEISAAAAAETVLSALDDLAGVRRLEDFAPETLSQLCRLSGAVGAALLVLDGDTLAVRAVQGADAFAPDLSTRSFSPADAPELFRALEQGQVEPLGAAAAKMLVNPSEGGLVVPMLRQQVRAVAVVVAAPPQTAAPLLRLAKLSAAFLKWQLLSEQFEAREQALSAAEATQNDRYTRLVQDYEQLAQAQQSAVERIAELEVQAQGLHAALQEAAAARQTAEAQAAQLQEKLAALESEYARLTELYRHLESAAEQARQATQEALARCEALSQEQATALRERDLFRARVELLETDLRQTRQRADRSAHQHAETLVRVHELEGELETARQARYAAEQALTELEQQTEASQRQMLERIAQLETLLAEAERAQAAQAAEAEQLAAQLAALREEAAAAQQSRLDAQHHAEALRQDLEATQQMLADAIARSQAAERTATELEERTATLLSEVIASHEEQARLIKDSEAMEMALKAAQTEADRQAQAVSLLESHIDALERSLATSEVARAALMQRMEALLAERADWRKTIDHLEARLAESRRASPSTEQEASPPAMPSSPEEQVARLRASLAQREAENATLRQRLALLQSTYRETVAVLQSRLDDFTKLNAISGAHRKLEDVLFGAPAPAALSHTPAVVVACDDERLCSTLTTCCQEAGYQTSAASDGDATLAALMLDPPYAIILAGTPTHIGDTYRRVRRNPDWRALPIVVIAPESFTGVAASPATAILAQRAVSPAALKQALQTWSPA
ncbi:MAG: PAS domain S-box protein [Chloracidobacterium sp.]|nr:PAS domain S-box protein [Chloracidobacterium sp.]MDW8218367.1 PAS domain S-box protein [Acidobacteriota bacterium]